jgi:type IV pilus assembly protein PilW
LKLSDFPTRGRQVGLTLIELMISVVIGLVVVGGVTYLYVGSKGAYRGNESLARIQEAGRFALDSITRDIRRAGALGCGSLASITTNQPVVASVLVPFTVFIPPSTGIDPAKLTVDPTGSPIPIVGFAPSQYSPYPATKPSGWAPPNVGTPPAPAPLYWGGDILQLQIASGVPARMSQGVDAANAKITIIDNTSNFSKNDYALLADCSSAAVFQITNTAGTGPVALTYATSATTLPPSISVNTFPTVQHFDQVTYYVGQVSGTNRTALYRYSMSRGTVEEVVDNVEDMDVSYGIGANGAISGAFQHANTMAAADWPNVISVRVSLLAVGDQFGAAPAAQTFALHGTGALATTAPDTRLRQVFSASTALRDRLQ